MVLKPVVPRSQQFDLSRSRYGQNWQKNTFQSTCLSNWKGKHMETPFFSCKHRGFNQETWKRNHILVGGTNGLAYPVAIYNSIFGHKTALPTGLGVQITGPTWPHGPHDLDRTQFSTGNWGDDGSGLCHDWCGAFLDGRNGRALLSRDETAPFCLWSLWTSPRCYISVEMLVRVTGIIWYNMLIYIN